MMKKLYFEAKMRILNRKRNKENGAKKKRERERAKDWIFISRRRSGRLALKV